MEKSAEVENTIENEKFKYSYINNMRAISYSLIGLVFYFVLSGIDFVFLLFLLTIVLDLRFNLMEIAFGDLSVFEYVNK